MLINLLRGAGTSGLAAMQPGPTKPLLALRRAQTRALCASSGLHPIDDPSNADQRFVRNRVRHEVLPLLSDVAKRDVVPLLVRTSDVLRADDRLLDLLAAEIDPTDALALGAADPALARRALRAWISAGRYPPDGATLDRAMDVVRGAARPATSAPAGASNGIVSAWKSSTPSPEQGGRQGSNLGQRYGQSVG